MRWPVYFIIVYIMLGLQLGLSSYTQFRGVAPNLMLLVVVFVSLNAPRAEALFSSFLLGIFQDLVTMQPLGLYAFSYGLVAILVAWSSEFVRRSHPLTHLSMTFLSGLLVSLVLMVHQLIRPVGPALMHEGALVGAIRLGPRVLIVSSVYTALLAPPVLWIFQRLHRFFGFDASHKRRSRV
jgi:rod shape-determining protein MreD